MLPAAADAAPTADGGRDESAAAAAAAALAQQLSDSGAGHNGDRNGGSGSGGASTSPTIMPDSGMKAALQIVTSGSGSSGGGSSGGGSRGGAPVSPRSLAKQLSAPCVLHSMPSRAFSSDGEDDGDEDDDNSSTVSGGLDTLDDMRTSTADGASPRSSRARGRAAHVAAIGLGDSAAAAAAPLAFDALSPLAAGRPPPGIGVMGRASSLRTLGLAWRLGKGSRIRTSSETDSEGSGAAATAAALVQPDGLELQQQCSGAAPSLSSPVPWFRNLMSDTRSRGSSEVRMCSSLLLSLALSLISVWLLVVAAAALTTPTGARQAILTLSASSRLRRYGPAESRRICCVRPRTRTGVSTHTAFCLRLAQHRTFASVAYRHRALRLPAAARAPARGAAFFRSARAPLPRLLRPSVAHAPRLSSRYACRLVIRVQSAGDAGAAQQSSGSAPRILAPAGAWQLDATALVLKPGPTFAVHRDSITGISLTRTLDDSASTPVTAAAAAAPPPSTPPAAAAPPPPPSPPPSAALLICTSSKDCSMKLTAILPPQQQQQQQQVPAPPAAAAADGEAPSPSTPLPPPPPSGVASTLRLRSPLLRMPSVQAAGLAATAPAASSASGSPGNTGGGGGSGGAAPAAAGSGGGFRALCRRQFVGTDLALGCCALTSNGKLAAAGCWDSSVVLYAVESASQVSRLRACHDDGVSCMALCEPAAARTDSGGGANGSSGGGSAPSSRRLLVTGAWDATVKVWGLQETGLEPAPAMDFFDLETPIHSVAIDPSGRLVAAGAEDGKVAVWEVHSGAMVFSYEAPTAHAVCAVLWVRRGDALCVMTALTSGYICRHSESGTLEGCLDLSVGITTMLSDGYTTIVACANGNVRILASCDADSAEAAFKQVARFETAATPNGGMLGGGATASAAITCMAIAPAAAQPPPPPSPPEPPPAAAAAAAVSGSDVDACLLAAGLEDGSVRLWTLQHAS
ncbi:hypothetical protein JKP88DRAFT_266910 [Tribonema minus]|uniref:Uncharacterized protein n=1 Tax=Tribonema minus TaxID=303371 RepID=A0A835ZFP3_9STRA|nr:hypothetical protein JKP88DRAFT_266910 [Tribonema minus]